MSAWGESALGIWGEFSMGESATAPRGRTAVAVRWNTFSMGVRQVAQIVGALIIARILGPEDFGVISAAMILVVLTPLILDLGLSSALIQRPELRKDHIKTTTTINVVSALILGGAVWASSGWIAQFFGSSALQHIYAILGIAMILKGLAVTPRALIVRNLRFKPLAITESIAAVVGVSAGIIAALAGARYDAVLWQVLLTDLITVVGLQLAIRSGIPGWSTEAFKDLVAFGARIFAANTLAYCSRNLDNILVGRFLGLDALAIYAMAYRVLVIPVQFIGQTVNRVMFPRFSRAQGNLLEVRELLMASTRLLAFVTIPAMALAAVAAPEAVRLILGDAWMAAAPLISILAIAGARETIFYITPALMRGLGRAKLNLRIEILATAVQVTGICIGLLGGVMGVAVGYLVAGMALVPVMLLVQRKLTGVQIRSQLLTLVPALHASGWGVLAYLVLRWSGLSGIPLLVVGSLTFALMWGAVSALVHRSSTRRSILDVAEVLGLKARLSRRKNKGATS